MADSNTSKMLSLDWELEEKEEEVEAGIRRILSFAKAYEISAVQAEEVGGAGGGGWPEMGREEWWWVWERMSIAAVGAIIDCELDLGNEGFCR